ncbi:penicillin-binding protein activator [Marinicella sediminis]|uniref:Penicillin-binding protein activator n=1 Tax=Marinicella sediminis TaxID=1792834 RepID=A0ABV7J517_9GAMM|nr:penicillin-binding protein activator [Marinicella sediminis]
MNKHLMQWTYLVLMVLALASCSSTQGPGTQPTDSREKRQGLMSYAQQDFFNAANLLSRANELHPRDPEVFNALLDAWYQMGEYVRIWQLLNQDPWRTPQSSLIEAELMVIQNQCDQATVVTASVQPELLTAEWQIRYWDIQTSCHASNKAWLEAAVALIKVNQLVTDPATRQLNDDQIVRYLIQVPQEQLIMMIGASEDELIEGWIEAAYINFGADGTSGAGWLNQWQGHPASYYFLDFNRVNNQQKVAVLLPLSGRFEEVAQAIQEGMLAAVLSDAGNQNELLFFDTGSQGENLANAWFSAQEQQVDLIIGPVDKNSIEQAVQLPEATTPVVLLNQADSNYFQFTLSPETEAEEVAEQMIADGHKNVIIMAPNDAWGERMTKAFAQRFVDLGGQITYNSYFQPAQNDYSAQLRQVLGLVESQLRARNLQQFLKLNLNAEEVVRADVDAIFLAARPAFARLMIPQLKFHRAADIPVYATSHVFDGLNNEQHNKDLEGVIFAISPIEIEAPYLFEILSFDLNKINSDKKLFAFGFDAYQLIARLEWMSRVNTGMIEGLTGDIRLGLTKTFRRSLLWAVYRNGLVRSLQD